MQPVQVMKGNKCNRGEWGIKQARLLGSENFNLSNLELHTTIVKRDETSAGYLKVHNLPILDSDGKEVSFHHHHPRLATLPNPLTLVYITRNFRVTNGIRT